MKASPPLPTVSAAAVARIGAAACSSELTRSCTTGGAPVQRALEVRPTANGGADLVDAATGKVVSPCASVELAKRTRNFFA